MTITARPDIPCGISSGPARLPAGSPHAGEPRCTAGAGDAFRSLVLQRHLPLARRLARRFAGRGEPLADLTQVAVVGLLVAADRYDQSRGVPFTSFAIPTILGELKRHFRDTTWPVRVSRTLQELTLQLPAAAEQLTRTLQHSPTTAELAAHLQVPVDEVRAAQRCRSAYRPQSLDQPLSDTTDLSLSALLGAPDHGYTVVEARETVRGLVAALPDRDRWLLRRRYVDGWSQTMIADEIGISQMQVSRLLAQIMTRLRTAIGLTDDVAPSPVANRRGPAGRHATPTGAA